MKMKWMKSAIALFSIMLVLAACGTGGDSDKTPDTSEKDEPNATEDAKTYKVGVTQILEHPSLNAALDGFKKALEDEGLDIEYNIQNAQNDMSSNSTIANNLVSAGVDLIFANSTPSAQAVATATQDIPVVFTSVTDAVAAELVASNEEPGGNITGTLDLHPDAIQNTLTFMKEELGAKNVGMVFNSGEQNSRSVNLYGILQNISGVGELGTSGESQGRQGIGPIS